MSTSDNSVTAVSRNRRRRHLINPAFQWRYLRNIIALEALAFVVAVLLTLAVCLLLLNSEMMIQGFWRALTISVIVASGRSRLCSRIRSKMTTESFTE